MRDAVRDGLRDWYSYLETQLADAAAAGEITEDPQELAFELIALVNEANARSFLIESDTPYGLAAAGMRKRLLAAGAPEAVVAQLDLG